MSTYRLCFIAKWNVCVAGSLFLQMLDVHYMNILEMWNADTVLCDGKMKYTSLLSFILVINESDPWLAKIKKKIKNMKKMELWESFLFFWSIWK